MRFIFVGSDGRVTEAHNDETVMELPEGAHEVTDEQWANRFNLLYDGRQLLHVEAAVPSTPIEEIRRVALLRIKAQRAPILDALAGIGFDAMVGGDQATVQAAADARTALKDITILPAFLAAETYDDMKAAIMARYKEIAAAAPAAVRNAFREVAS